MRKTKEELMKQFPWRNESVHDIVKASYGDIPVQHWDEVQYKKYQDFTLMAIETYIYANYGNYNIYRTLNGQVYVSENGEVLCGDVDVYCKGKRYTIIMNQMYGRHGLDIHYLDVGKVIGFSNADGQGSPSNKKHTEEMDEEVIQRIMNDKMEDYGIGIQMFMQAARELYEQDKTNHIMEKTFDFVR